MDQLERAFDLFLALGAMPWAVYCLYNFEARGGVVEISYSEVGDCLGIGRSSVSRANAVLEREGLIRVESGGSERKNRYELLDVDGSGGRGQERKTALKRRSA